MTTSGHDRREREVSSETFRRLCGRLLRSEHTYEHGRFESNGEHSERRWFLFEPPDWRDDVVPGMVVWDAGSAWQRGADAWYPAGDKDAWYRSDAEMPAVLAPGDLLRDPRKDQR